jgi:hypothetical protein
MNVSDAIRLKRCAQIHRPTSLKRPSSPSQRRARQSSKNTQPWHFIAITDKATLKRSPSAANGPGISARR